MLPAIRWRFQPATESTTAPVVRSSSTALQSLHEWAILLKWNPSVLIECAESVAEATLLALTPHLRRPISRWNRRDYSAGVPAGTLIVWDVATLDLMEQQQLLQALDRGRAAGRLVQVVATSSRPLFLMVEHAAFVPDLYYRLNVVRVDLSGAST